MEKGIIIGAIAPHPPLLIPEVGGSELARAGVTIWAMQKMAEKVSRQNPEVIIIVSPHSPTRADAMGIATAPVLEGDFGQFRAPQVRMKLSTHQPLVEAVVNEARKENFPLRSTSRGQTGPELDWGVMVPMYFLRQASPSDIPVLCLSFSGLSYGAHLAYGGILQRAAGVAGVRAALVASGDMSHHLSNASPYGYNPMGPVFDDAVADAVAHWDAATITGIEPGVIQGAGECGLRSIIVLFGALEGLPVASEVLSHEGPFGIGYLVALATVKEAHDGQL